MAKLLFILIMAGALADGLTPKEPPLLIDSPPSPTAPLDAAN